MADLFDNPMGTDGFEFVEYTAPDTEALGRLFEGMGFSAVARHRSKRVTLYKQGGINFLVNAEPDSFAQSFARVHGPSACAFGIRVKDAATAFKRAVALGAKPYDGPVGPMELNIPAIQGIGGSLLYLIDRYGARTIYDVDFVPVPGTDPDPKGVGLEYVDHLTHNVYEGRMDTWAQFYTKLFNFREIRYFDIKGKKTGLTSRALTSPCGKIRIPINEPSDKKSQIQEYLDAYNGEGIQHIALPARTFTKRWRRCAPRASGSSIHPMRITRLSTSGWSITVKTLSACRKTEFSSMEKASIKSPGKTSSCKYSRIP